MDRTLTFAIAGDGSIGKTALALAFLDGTYDSTYLPTVLEIYRAKPHTFNNIEYNIKIIDTAGQEEYDRLRIMNYPACDCIILGFSLMMPFSLANIKDKWILELKEHVPNKPVVLVGTQSDLRDQALLDKSKKDFVTAQKGEQVRKAIGAFKYVECSALAMHNVNQVFEACIEAFITPKPTESAVSAFFKKCSCVRSESS